MIRLYKALICSSDNRYFIFLLFFVLGFEMVIAQRPGTLENTVTGVSIPITYTQAPTNILSTYQELYRITTPAGKLLYEITLIHDQGEAEIRCSIVPQGPFEPIIKKYDPIRTGLFFSNKSDLDTNISQLATADESYTFICSFGDSLQYGVNYRKDPFLHKLHVDNGLFLLLDPISPKRIERHKGYISKVIEQINFEARMSAQQEEVRRMQAEAYTKDSLLKATSLRAEKRMQDSLQYEKFIQSMTVDAESFYKAWREDTDLVVQIHQKILTHYRASLESMENTRVDGEWYSGDKKHRRKQGAGISVVGGVTFYDGYFNEDTFVSGKAIIYSSKKTYIGEISEGTRNGLGLLRSTDGNYLLGHFEGGEFADGISSWNGSPNSVAHYFGGYSNGQHNGFGELSYKNDSMYVGIFRKDAFITGFIKRREDGRVVFYKVENGIQQPVEPWVGYRFEAEVDYLKKKYSEVSKKNYEENTKVLPSVTSEQKPKYRISNYIGISMGAAIPAFGFNQNPAYAGTGPQASLDAWFRFANAIGLRMKIGCAAPTVSGQYQLNFNDRHSSEKVFSNSKMMWLIHYYDLGLGLNLGGKVASLEIAALGGLSVIHQPRYNVVTGKEGLVVGKVSWDFVGEASLRFNCTEKFAFRFGATYLLTSVMDYRGYFTNDAGGLEDWNGDNVVGDTKTIWIHSINPFIGFVGLF